MPLEKWLSYRPKSMGASDAGAILGLNPWKSAVDVWLEKTGQAEPIADNWNMKIGRDMEPLIRGYIFEQEGLRIRQDNFIRYDKKDPLFSTNLDGVVIGEKVPVEIKTTTMDREDIPDYYFAQAQHQLMVMNKPYLYFATLNLGYNKNLTVNRFDRNDVFIKKMRAEMKKFWVENVIAKIPPLPMSVEDAAKAFPQEEVGKVYIANQGVRDALIEMKEIKERLSEGEALYKSRKLDVLNSMTNAERIVDSGKTAQLEGEDGLVLATWKKNRDGVKFDVKRFKEDNIEEHNKYLITVTGARVFLPK